MRDKIIVAFDVHQKKDFVALANALRGKASYIKIGMECFYSIGPDSVKMAKDAGFKVFLDLKLHDIPNTVYQSVKALAELGADMMNAHALGGLEMMKAAKKAADESTSKPLLIAVTHLTSLDQKAVANELGISASLENSVLSLSKLAQEAKLDGVVCSANEILALKKALGKRFVTVTPGIRLPETGNQDQKRVATPQEAASLGTDYMVIGRSVTQSKNPSGIFQKILEDIS